MTTTTQELVSHQEFVESVAIEVVLSYCELTKDLTNSREVRIALAIKSRDLVR
jgi:hypothetical protein